MLYNATYTPEIEDETPAKPFARGLHFSGRTSLGTACVIAVVESVKPMRIPPPTSASMDWARAETTAPAKAINGGIAARYFLSRTSDNLPIIGDNAACTKSGP